jgi:CubicO group peptidase (beta-lactamase class C family)
MGADVQRRARARWDGLHLRRGPGRQFLSDYLQQPAIHDPGFFAYSNTNFTILGVLFEIWSGAAPGSHVSLVKQSILAPLGIDTDAEITDQPRPAVEALSYSGSTDTRPGQVWPQMDCIAPGGWLGTAFGVLKFLMGLRTDTVLQPATSEMMFNPLLGWYRGTSPHGPHFHHNGGLHNEENPAQILATGAIHFPPGFDAVLFVNSRANAIRRRWPPRIELEGRSPSEKIQRAGGRAATNPGRAGPRMFHLSMAPRTE